MSVLIGVCGKNFCLLTADTRLLVPTDAGVGLQTDEAHKAMKLNRNVLVGVGGVFGPEEAPLAAFEALPKKQELSFRSACKTAAKQAQSLLAQPEAQPGQPSRFYMLGGRDAGGSFRICTLRADFATGQLIKKEDEPSRNQLYLSLMLPQELQHLERPTMARMQASAKAATSQAQLAGKMQEIIRWLSLHSSLIGSGSWSVRIEA